jgi:predicted YcjX-like family ATPase
MWIEESWNGLRPAAAEAQQAQRRDRHVHRACLEQAHYLLAASHSSGGLVKSAAVMTLLAISAASRVPIFDPVKEAETERVQLREKVESAKDSRSNYRSGAKNCADAGPTPRPTLQPLLAHAPSLGACASFLSAQRALG